MNQDMMVNEEVDVFNMTVIDYVPRMKRAVRTHVPKERLLELFRAERDQNQGLNLAAWCGMNGIGFTTYNWLHDQLNSACNGVAV